MLVNPSKRPTGDIKATVAQEIQRQLKPRGKTKRRSRKKAKRAASPAAAAPATKKARKARRARAGRTQMPYRDALARPHTSRAKNPSRGLRALERDRRSIHWNARFGTAAARNYLRDKFPQVNPGEMLKSAGLGAASFLGSRVLANFASRLPLPDIVKQHLPVLAAAGATGLSWWFTRKRPQLRAPLLYGAGLALLDAVLRNWVTHYVPQVAGFLGGYVPDGQAGRHRDLAFLVREALANWGDGGRRPMMTDGGHDGMSNYIPAGRRLRSGMGDCTPGQSQSQSYIPTQSMPGGDSAGPPPAGVRPAMTDMSSDAPGGIFADAEDW